MSLVTVYSSNFCSTCQMVKQFLALRGVEYVEKNVSTDLQGRSELLALGFDATPVTVIGQQCVAGFDVNDLDAALSELRAWRLIPSPLDGEGQSGGQLRHADPRPNGGESSW